MKLLDIFKKIPDEIKLEELSTQFTKHFNLNPEEDIRISLMEILLDFDRRLKNMEYNVGEYD